MTSYSQYGEDSIFVPLLPERGMLLEIGAWHPRIFSNSRALIEKGWKAILVEPSPYAMVDLLNEYGPQTISPEIPPVVLIQAAVVADEPNRLLPMHVSRDAVSTADLAVHDLWKDTAKYEGRVWAATIRARTLAEDYGSFDFVSIDAEGLSVDILDEFISCCSNERLPKVVMVEHDNRLDEVQEIAGWRGYREVHRNGTNVVYSRP